MRLEIRRIASRAVSLITLEAAIAQGVLPRILSTTKDTIITTVHATTHQQHARQIQQLSANHHIRFVPYFAPLVHTHYANPEQSNHHPTQSGDAGNHQRISLLLGNNNPAFQSALDPTRVVTLEQICSVFPEKVPLSMRSKDNTAQRERLQARLGFKISDKAFPLENILMASPSVKMWDEAIQLVLDYSPSPLIVPYLKPHPHNDQLYRLTLQDFLSGLRKVHTTVSTAVKTHPPLNILQYDQRKQLDWIIGQVASAAEEMAIDSYFFTNPPKIGNCEGRVRVTDCLKEIL